MSFQTTEAALEASIERALTGGVTVAVKEAVLQEPTSDYGGNGWKRGSPGDFSAAFAVDEAILWVFLERTRAEELTQRHDEPRGSVGLAPGLKTPDSRRRVPSPSTLIPYAVSGGIAIPAATA